MDTNNSAKYLPYIAMFYMMIKLITVIMIYKITNIYGIDISVSTLIIPIWFVCGDIIAEVYGYRIAKNLVFATIIFQIFFGLLISLLSTAPTANIINNTILYDGLVANMLRVSLASSMGLLIGGIYNAYMLIWLRDKILYKMSFALRSFIASSISELLFTIVVYIIEFYKLIEISSTLKLIAVSFLTKEILTPILTIFIATKIVNLLKSNNDKINTSDLKVTELFTNNLNQSSFRQLIVDLGVNHPLGQYSENIKVKSMQFRKFPPGLTFDMHVAPCKQYIVYLDGEVEVTSSHNTNRMIFKAGDILLANDLDGEGHITRTLSSGTSIIIQTE